ncbi:hypothetical protein Tco_0407210 [Tanacetum coccineum]
MDLMHSTPSMYYDYDAHVKGELLVIMKNSQCVNLLIFISNTLIELFNDFGSDHDGILKRLTMYFNLWRYKTEMELTLEQTQQGVSYEVSVDPHGFKGNLKMEVKEGLGSSLKPLEALGSPWKLLEDLEASCRRL